MDKPFGSGVLNWDLNCFVRMNLQESIIVNSNRLYVVLLKPFRDGAIKFPVVRWIFKAIVVELIEPDSTSCLESFA